MEGKDSGFEGQLPRFEQSARAKVARRVRAEEIRVRLSPQSLSEEELPVLEENQNVIGFFGRACRLFKDAASSKMARLIAPAVLLFAAACTKATEVEEPKTEPQTPTATATMNTEPAATIAETPEPTVTIDTSTPTPINPDETPKPTESAQEKEPTVVAPLNQEYVENLKTAIRKIDWRKYLDVSPEGLPQDYNQVYADKHIDELEKLVEDNNDFGVLAKLLAIAEEVEFNPDWISYTGLPEKITSEKESSDHQILRMKALGLKSAMERKYQGDAETLAKIERTFWENPVGWDPERQKDFKLWSDLIMTIPKLSRGHLELVRLHFNIYVTLDQEGKWLDRVDFFRACRYPNDEAAKYTVENIIFPWLNMVASDNGETTVIDANGQKVRFVAPREFLEFEKQKAKEDLRRCRETLEKSAEKQILLGKVHRVSWRQG